MILKDGIPTGEYEDFMTGLVIDDDHTWGRPVGVGVTQDGSLLVSDGLQRHDLADRLHRNSFSVSMHVAGLEGEHRYGRAGSFPTTTATTTVKASWPVDILQRARGQSQTAPPSPGRERFATARS